MMCQVMTEKQLCDILNMKPSTIARLRREEGLPHIRVGKLIRYSYTDVQEWLKGHKVNLNKNKENSNDVSNCRTNL